MGLGAGYGAILIWIPQCDLQQNSGGNILLNTKASVMGWNAFDLIPRMHVHIETMFNRLSHVKKNSVRGECGFPKSGRNKTSHVRAAAFPVVWKSLGCECDLTVESDAKTVRHEVTEQKAREKQTRSESHRGISLVLPCRANNDRRIEEQPAPGRLLHSAMARASPSVVEIQPPSAQLRERL